MAGETTTAAPGGFVAQMTAWQNGQPAPTAEATPPAADSPKPAATPPAGSPPAQEAPPAQGTPPPVSESTPPVGDQPPASPPAADSGAPKAGDQPTDPKADQRVSDAQRKMHEATERAKAAEAKVEAALKENLSLTTQLQTLLTRPDLQPVTAEAFDVNEAVKGVIAEYKKPAAEGGPKDDDEALALLVSKTLEVGSQRMSAERLAEENQRRTVARQALVHHAVNTFVSDFDADLPLPLFWAMVPYAEAETPAELKTADQFQARLDWQVKRAIAKSHALLEARAERVRETTLHTERTERAAEVVMPGGGSAAPVGAPAKGPERPLTMVEQIDQLQRRTMPAA